MTEFSGLRSLGRLIALLEKQVEGARLTILTHENREEIARFLIEGLLEKNTGKKLQIETSSGEYINQIATLECGKNEYIFSKDHQGVFISEWTGYACRITPDSHGILVYHRDYPGVVHDVSRVLAEKRINIASMNVSREQKGKEALLVSLTDEEISADLLGSIARLPEVSQVLSLQ